MCSCINIIKAHLEKSKQMSKSGFFPIAIAYWSRLGIFRQNGENTTKLGWLDSKETQGQLIGKDRSRTAVVRTKMYIYQRWRRSRNTLGFDVIKTIEIIVSV